MRSQNRTKCVKYVWLSYPTWPSRWVLCISMLWLRLKGCHVACDEWTSGEICSFQHMWVTGSVMWAASSDESLKFGVQGASATNWFPRVNGARDNGIRLYMYVYIYIYIERDISIIDTSLKIANLRSQPHYPGAIELNPIPLVIIVPTCAISWYIKPYRACHCCAIAICNILMYQTMMVL